MNGYQYNSKDGLWCRAGFSGIAYTDGVGIEAKLLDIIVRADDCSVFSEELRDAICDWPTEYHLSRARHCLLRPLPIKSSQRVLELGAGCGAITRYLGELGATVVSVEGGAQRARIAAARCRDLANVQVVLDNLVDFQSEERFDWVLMIGVLEYAPLFAGAGHDSLQAYLSRAKDLMAPGGQLVIAIENQLGLKYFNGCSEDHTGIPYFGLQDRYNDQTAITFGRNELVRVMQSSGYSAYQFYYPWPDYKIPSVVLSEDIFKESRVSISDLLLRCDSRDYQSSFLPAFSEHLVVPVLERNHLLGELSNSFLLVASAEESHFHCSTEALAWLFSCTARKREYATQTLCRKENGSLLMEKQQLQPHCSASSQQVVPLVLRHHCTQEAYIPGRLAVIEIFQGRIAASHTHDLVHCFLPWFREILGRATVGTGTTGEELEDWYIDGSLIDATPFNFIRDEQGQLVLFDREWQVEGEVPLGWLLYRAIIWGWFGGVPEMESRQIFYSVYELLAGIAAQAGLRVHPQNIIVWQGREQAFQLAATGRFPGALPLFFVDNLPTCSSLLRFNDTFSGQLEEHLVNLHDRIEAIQSSWTWRLGALPVTVVHRVVELFRLFCHVVRRVNPRHRLESVWTIARRDGLAGLHLRLAGILHGPAKKSYILPADGGGRVEVNDYSAWLDRYDRLNEEVRSAIVRRCQALRHPPLLSVIMPVFNPDLDLLQEAVDSVREQLYPHWQLCIADDASTDPAVRPFLEQLVAEEPRIRIVFRSENGHISAASNSALELAEGWFVALLDQDDTISPTALYRIASEIDRAPDVQLIYSDEDKLDRQGRRFAPTFKGDWNPDLFRSYNNLSHLGVYRTSLVRAVGGFRIGFEGAQDYDLALRCVERVRRDQLVHIPKILYHWRAVAGSTAFSIEQKPYAMEAGRRALEEHLQRTGVQAKCEQLVNAYRIRYRLPTPVPKVSLVMAVRRIEARTLLCLQSLLDTTDYPDYEIVLVMGGTDQGMAGQLPTDQRLRLLPVEAVSDYDEAPLYNVGAKAATGDILGLVHDDLQVIGAEWMQEMVSQASRPNIGAVGARLWSRQNTLNHGGYILGIRGTLGHALRGTVKGFPGYRRRAELVQNVSAVSGACLFVNRDLYMLVGGLDEGCMGVRFYDADFCLRLRELGYWNLWTPYAELYHDEVGSAVDSAELVPVPVRLRAQFAFVTRWEHALREDGCYNPNLTLEREDFSLAWPPRVTVSDV